MAGKRKAGASTPTGVPHTIAQQQTDQAPKSSREQQPEPRRTAPMPAPLAPAPLESNSLKGAKPASKAATAAVASNGGSGPAGTSGGKRGSSAVVGVRVLVCAIWDWD